MENASIFSIIYTFLKRELLRVVRGWWRQLMFFSSYYKIMEDAGHDTVGWSMAIFGSEGIANLCFEVKCQCELFHWSIMQ